MFDVYQDVDGFGNLVVNLVFLFGSLAVLGLIIFGFIWLLDRAMRDSE